MGDTHHRSDLADRDFANFYPFLENQDRKQFVTK